MDSSIISTIITAIASVITCIIGMRTGQKDASTISTRKIREKQLSCLYTPLEKLLTFTDDLDASDLFLTAEAIIKDNLELVPTVMMSEIEKFKEDKSRGLLPLRTVVSSFYNCTRKSLGYPFDSSKIKSAYTPTYDRNLEIKGTAWLTFVVLWGICTMNIFSILLGGGQNVPEWLKQVSVIVSICGTVPFTLLFLSQQHKR